MPIPSSSLFRPVVRCTLGFCLLLAVAVAESGCAYYRSLGNGQRMAPARPRPHRSNVFRGDEDIVIAVTTNMEGAVANIQFIKHSRSEAVDGYITQTIADGFPRQPSTRTVVKLKHTSQGGFGEPQVISSEPAQTQAVLPAQ